MNLEKFPRRRYTENYTPIEFEPNFTKALGGGPNIYFKRDDLLGLTMGGNKTRKLEFLMADAIAQGADTILTCGAVQSNHCRLTLSAAVKEGLNCQLILEERVPGSYDKNASGNNFLFNLLGVEDVRVVPGGSDMMGELEKLAEELRAEGRNPYIIPGGGSNALGSLGYVACGQEIIQQMFDEDIQIDHIVTCSGSGGTHAGLLAAFIGTNTHIPITGISVGKDAETQAANIVKLAKKVWEKLEIENELDEEDVVVYADHVGPGYGISTEEMVDAIQLLARTEGILTDPVYTGKVLAALITMVKEDYFNEDDNVLFIHTGGAPALFAYEDEMIHGVE